MLILSLAIAYIIGWRINRRYDGLYDKYKHFLWGCSMHRWGVPVEDVQEIAEYKEQTDNVYDKDDIIATITGWHSYKKGKRCRFGIGVV